MRVSIVITTINEPNVNMEKLCKGAERNNWGLYIVGDRKSPKNFALPGACYLSIEEQKDSSFKYSRLCPENHYARKNIGYLYAISYGAGIIKETDDDNYPFDDFFQEPLEYAFAYPIKRDGWYNVYSHFSDRIVWPRGLPLTEVFNENIEEQPQKMSKVYVPIQQGLADENPDVDAVFRLVHQLPVKFFYKLYSIALSGQAWSPFNSQNTVFFSSAYPLLYLPAYCSFRMTDIWRSFVAQRIIYANGWHILYHGPTVRQERNPHDLMKDFEDEIPGYLKNNEIRNILLDVDLQGGENNIDEDMLRCYTSLIQKGIIDKKEIKLLKAWLADLKDATLKGQI